MKLRTLTCLSALFIIFTCAAQPRPAHQTPASGTCRITPYTTLRFDTILHPQAAYLTQYIHIKSAHKPLSSNTEILLALDETLQGEAYRLTVSPRLIKITAGEASGIFNGIQSLLRLCPADIYSRTLELPLEIPCTHIEDAPRFAYRGMMLDVARTWVDQQGLERYIDLLAYHNINKLHLHLSDDEGWRIEIKSHPKLTSIGAYRGGDSPVRAVYGKWDEKYGGYYTQEQIRALINYAAVRNIEIIPEIELPGHSRNIASVYPEIRCNFPPDTLSTNGYDYRSAWCVAREENYPLLEDILKELCALFPSKYIHVGGDEVETKQWESCPDCRALMTQRGITDARKLEDIFMERLATILQRYGKYPGVWNEAARSGSLTRKSLIYGWENSKACLNATAKGYRTVVMPGQYFYFDMRQTPREDGHDWAAIFDATKVYSFSFEGFSAEQLRYVEGLQGSFFSEAYISHAPEKPDYLDYMCYPRICALARIAWNGNSEGWDTYYKELYSTHYDRMAAMGIRFRLFPPKLTYTEGVFTASTSDGAEIFYTQDGSNEELRYTHPLRVQKPHLYRFFTRYKTAHSPYVEDKSYHQTLTPMLTITSSMGESIAFPYTNASTYKGLTRTSRACRQRDWVLYTYAQPIRCREMYLQSGNRQLPKTIITTGYAEVSYDGINFEAAGELEKGSITLHPLRPVKAVRLISTCRDNGTPYVTIQPPRIKPVL